MADLLYQNFLNDPQEYEQAQAHWKQGWQDLVRKLRLEKSWTSPWLNTTFADGTPFRDGNPIFTAVCTSRHLGIRVIQLEPLANSPELEFWTDTFAEGGPQAIRELVISCALSQETFRAALDLMSEWIERETIPPGPEGAPPTEPAGPAPLRPSQEQVTG
jgi:hypothetical protein